MDRRAVQYFLGIDVGTTGIKALVVSDAGEVVGRYAVPLKMQIPRPAWAEQDPETWKNGVIDILRKVAGDFCIGAIGFSGQMHSLVTLDGKDDIIRPAILWCDQRTTKQCLEATEILGGEREVIRIIGNPILEGFTLPKILWIRDEEPDHYSRIRKIVLPKDYIVYSLTGSFGTEPSDASGTACYDVTRKEWAIKMLERVGVSSNILPTEFSSSDRRGALHPKLSEELGWNEVPVVSGGADNASAALGVSMTKNGDAMVSLGTSGTVVVLTESKQPDEQGKIHYFRHVLPELSYYMGVMLSAANSINWMRNQFFADHSWQEIEKIIATTPAGSNGVIFLPYLQGERTPHRDPHARGVFFGISSANDRNDLLRSVFEGITFGLRESFELIKAKTTISSMRVVGGGAKNSTWSQMIADNFMMPVQIPAIDEGGAFGAAMLAAIGSGIPLAEVSSWVTVESCIDPSPDTAQVYERVFEQYKSLYWDLKQRFKEAAP